MATASSGSRQPRAKTPATKKSPRMTPQQREEFFRRLAATNPEPQTELHYQTPFELLVAVVLSAQATDKSVNLATAKLFAKANTPESFLKLGEEKLKNYIKTIGLFNTKAANIMKACRILVDEHHGHVPSDRESLEKLPGVGRKTANVILNTAFGQETIAVDTHIFRVANRTGLAPGKNVVEVEERLLKAVLPEFRRHAHHWLILHGRYICTARKPHCERCPVADQCRYPDKTIQ